MSQQDRTGESWSGLSVAAGDPLDVGPGVASCATRGSWSSLERVEPSGFVPVSAMPGESFQSRADAVGHEASPACADRASPASCELCCWRSAARGVLHPASRAASVSVVPLCRPDAVE
jgi:hypothetical protein